MPGGPSPLMNRFPRWLRAEQGNKDRWLISYTDFVTILMILFVAIAAQGFHAVQKPTPPPTPQHPAQHTAQPPGPSAALRDADQKLRGQGLDSRLEKRGLVITLPQAILFPSGEDRIVPSAFPVLAEIAGVLGSVPNKVALVGHADSVPIHNKR